MSKANDRPAIPQSVRHKRILALAEERPDASLNELADEIPMATADLVENVLDQYGDPADTAEDSQAVDEDDASETDDQYPNVKDRATTTAGDEEPDSPAPEHEISGEDLSAPQRETLQKIHEHPDATQRELGEMLDVTAATISNRVSGIDGFDWDQRADMVDRMWNGTSTDETLDSMTSTQTTTGRELGEITERIDRLEQQLEATGQRETGGVFADAELTQKVLHACMDSELVNEEEELRLIRAIIE